MPVLNLTAYKPAPNTTTDANAITNAFTAVETIVNGLDASNWAAGKIFDPAKLLQAGATDTNYLGWSASASQWQPMTIPATAMPVATTVAGLGAGTAGKQGLIRLMPSTYNNGGATALPAATITVGDTAEFPTAGTLTTANGTITYTGKTATTFTGCTGGTGTLAANAAITLATGTLPNGIYDTIAVVYDAVMGKWVSASEWHRGGGSGATSGYSTLNTTSFTELSNLSLGDETMPAARGNWRALDAAGLKPQLRVSGRAQVGAALTFTIQPSWLGQNRLQVGLPTQIGQDASAVAAYVWASGGAFASFSTLWGALPGGYTLFDYLYPSFQAKVSANSVMFQSDLDFETRWVG